MLSIARNFLFVHIPKTAGNSLQNILQSYSNDELVCTKPWQDGIERFGLKNNIYPTHKHSTLNEYKELYPADLYQKLIKFAVIRNTYERAMSSYFSPHRNVSSWDSSEFIAFLESGSVKSLRDFICYPNQNLEEGLANLNHVLRYESLNADFSNLCAQLDIPIQALPIRNKSQRSSLTDLYRPDTIKFIREMFYEEIEYFQFEVPQQ